MGRGNCMCNAYVLSVNGAAAPVVQHCLLCVIEDD